mgnify:CR=1 FL=1
MIWISTVTGYPVPEPPSIVFVETPRDLFRIANGCDLPDRSKSDKKWCERYDKKADEFGTILALYDPEKKTIILQKGWTSDTIPGRSILVHELVHHMQYMSGQISKFKCQGKIEKEAYDVQNKWLEPYGLDVHKALKIGPLFLFMATQCEENNGWFK